jgi:hypothetical protein
MVFDVCEFGITFFQFVQTLKATGEVLLIESRHLKVMVYMSLY